MENEKIIIIALIAVIAMLLVGIFAVMPNLFKEEAILNFKTGSSLNEGDLLTVALTDENGNPISGERINITVTDSDGATDYHSVLTDSNGNGKLKMEKDPGSYDISVSFDGNGKFKGCSAAKKIKVEEQQQEAVSQAPTPYAYQSDGTPMYSQQEVDNYMLNKYGMVDYHVGSNGYIDMDEPGFDDAGNYIGYY